MFKLLIRWGFVLLVINGFVTLCKGDDDPFGIRYNIEMHRSSLNAQKALEGLFPSEQGLGLSAWGIITVVVSIILAIVGMYYISICYPVLCQKPKKYEGMGIPPPV